MDIRGIQKFTLVDYPGKLAAVFFCGGCNFRCPYCHNPCLVLDPTSQPPIPLPEIEGFLSRRHGKLDGVVFSGGEPTLQRDLPEVAKRVRALGFSVKIDTNGSHPDMIEELWEAGAVDALGVDFKAPTVRYDELSGCDADDLTDRVLRTLRFALEHGIELDIRTTVHRTLLSEDDLAQMHGELREIGADRWTLQQFHVVDMIDDELAKQPTYGDQELLRIAARLEGAGPGGPEVKVRGLTGIFLKAE